MAARLDYQWHLRQVMATRTMFSTTDLIGPLAGRDIQLSSSQVYRLVTDRPERLSLKVLMALLDILYCTMDEPIEPVPAAVAGRKKKASAGGRAEAGVGEKAAAAGSGPSAAWLAGSRSAAGAAARPGPCASGGAGR
jgi:hypothetical protein